MMQPIEVEVIAAAVNFGNYVLDMERGERRIIQKSKGYRYTLVNGVVTFEEGNRTGALPGKLLRSTDVAA